MLHVVLTPCVRAPGDARKLLEDCVALAPTVFCAVPRVYERVYAGVMDKVTGQQ
jgi:long-subunit acyl-CoA synthetase (AMP-forming)